MTSAVEPLIEALMSEPQMRQRIASILKDRVGRTTLFRWRQELGLQDEVFTPAYACALAVFGRCRRNRMSIQDARLYTINFCKENNL